jgi:hypothetical protein
MSAGEELHVLVDRIRESDVPTMQKLLRSLVDPVELAILSVAIEYGLCRSGRTRRAAGPKVLRWFGGA